MKQNLIKSWSTGKKNNKNADTGIFKERRYERMEAQGHLKKKETVAAVCKGALEKAEH